MSLQAIGDEELLDYVIEKDFEDTASRVILSALSSFNDGIGKGKISNLLRGKNPGFILSGKIELMDHFGRLSLLDQDQILDFVESLIRLELIEVSDSEFPRISISKKGKRSLKRGSFIPALIPWPLPSKQIPIPVDIELYEDLKKERNSIARDEGLPPYCVASNLSLVEIVNSGITDPKDLVSIPGMGEVRSERYGERLLSLIQHIG